MAKKRAASKRSKQAASARRRGRPKREQAAVSAETVEVIGDWLLEGQPCSSIAKRLAIDESTVRYYRDNILRPRWEGMGKTSRAVQLAKVDRLEAFAWERLRASTQPTTRRQIKRALAEAIGEGERDKGKGSQELAIVERVMVKVTRTGEACWAQILQWCADYRARVFGFYAPTRHQVDVSELRVAGPDPSAVDQAMLERLAERIRERKRFQAALRPESH